MRNHLRHLILAAMPMLALLGKGSQASAQHFALSSASVTGSNALAVVVADVNGDGKLDLLSANYGENTVTVLTNRGNGLFAGSSTNGVGAAPRSVVAANVNGDGRMDLVSANEGDNTLTVLTNTGNGRFAISVTLTVGNRPGGVAAADVNGDGKADLICANTIDETLTVLTNSGSGTFALSATLPVGFSPRSVAAADVNTDGKADLISANYGDNTLTVLINGGNGTFTQSATFGVGGNPMSVVAADVNGDGKVDLISTDSSGDSLTVLSNDGSGTFTFAATLPVGRNPGSVAAADVNGDAKMDLISANSGGGTLSVLINIGNGSFTFSTPATVGSGLQCVAAAEVNGDGRVDLIGSVSNTLVVLLSGRVPPAETAPAYDFSIGSSVGLRDPRGVAVDRSGNVYVTDRGNNRIVKFTGKGQFLGAWGGAGNAAGQFSHPLGIAADGDNMIYVADPGNNRVQKFTSNGAYVTQWTCTSPAGVAVGRSNNVYVTGGGIETLVFDPWGGGTWPVYVSGVWKFANDGTVLQKWPLNTTPFVPPAYQVSLSGGYTATGLAVDQDDSVYVSYDYHYQSSWNGVVQSWSGAGIELFTTNATYVLTGTDYGNVAPAGMAVDSANNLYVADILHNRIEKSGGTGDLLAQWGIAGGALGQLSGPRGVAVDRSGNFLYVADSGNNRILVFAFRPTLNIQPNRANTTVASWSTAAIGFKLQSTLNLTPPVTWVDLTNAPALIGEQFTLTNTASSGQFFRLRKP